MKKSRLLLASALLALMPGLIEAQSVSTPLSISSGAAPAAVARGVDAGLFNPASLAGHKGFQLRIPGIAVQGAIAPISFGYIEGLGTSIDDTEKADLLQRITAAGGLNLGGAAGIRWLGLSAGSFAVNIATTVEANGTISPGVLEAVLYGNLGQSADAASLDLRGNNADASAVTTVSLSHGREIGIPFPGKLAIGVSAKAVVFGAAMARDREGLVNNNPVSVYADADVAAGYSKPAFGLDAAVQWRLNGVRVSLVVPSVVSMNGDIEPEDVYRARLYMGEDTSYAVLDTLRFATLPAVDQIAIKERLNAPRERQRIVLAGSFETGPLLLGAELHLPPAASTARFDDHRLGVAAAFQPIGLITLRGGLSVSEAKKAISGGADLHIGPLTLSGAASRTLAERSGWGAAFEVGIH